MSERAQEVWVSRRWRRRSCSCPSDSASQWSVHSHRERERNCVALRAARRRRDSEAIAVGSSSRTIAPHEQSSEGRDNRRPDHRRLPARRSVTFAFASAPEAARSRACLTVIVVANRQPVTARRGASSVLDGFSGWRFGDRLRDRRRSTSEHWRFASAAISDVNTTRCRGTDREYSRAAIAGTTLIERRFGPGSQGAVSRCPRASSQQPATSGTGSPVDVEDRVRLIGAVVDGGATDEVEAAEKHTLRSVDVVGIEDDLAGVVVDVGDR
jgi:hypothetical protein